VYRKIRFNILLFTILCACWGVVSTAHAVDMGLVGLLSNQLGVSKDQASGGAGSIFQLAKNNLSSEDFGSVANVVPGMDQLLAAAPQQKKASGSLGNLSSMVGGSSNKIGGLASLAGAFGQLGMSGDMVGKFTPIILEYVKNMGGDMPMSLLKGALK